MRTVSEIVEENFKGLGDLIEDKELAYFYKGVIAECMKGFAEEVIDELAAKSQEMIYDAVSLNENETIGMILRNFQVCYAVPKQTILQLKEKL